MKSGISLFFSFLSAAIFFLPVQYAHATLGESADSVEMDRIALSASRLPVKSEKSYTVHEIASAVVTIREYVSVSGVVFAISWKGMNRPDLSQLLGSYSGEYYEALQQTPRRKGSRHLQVKTPHIVVEKWGHMRSLQGRAYIPALMPAGVNIDEIR